MNAVSRLRLQARRRWLPLAVALLALPALAPAPAAAVGTNPGQSPSCTPGVSTEVAAASRPGQPVRVGEGASVVCPTPEAPAGGGSFGPQGSRQSGPPGTPGQPCTATVLEPMELSLTPGGQELVFWPDPANPGTGSDTPEPQDVGRVISGIGAKEFFMQGGTVDYYNPFRLNGQWDGTGFKCVPKDPNNPQGSFTPVCTGATIAIGCLIANGHTITDGPVAGGATLNTLRQQAAQLIHPGQITSLPAQPNPALVNRAACFFIDGVNIDNQDVNRVQTFQIAQIGAVDGTGRRVFHIIVVEISYVGTRWTFGDGSDDAEGLAPQCVGASNAPLQFGHTYRQYSPPNGFPITATETFNVHVTENWIDSRGLNVNEFDLAPIDVQPGPVPQFRKIVVQEEGVPIG
ncbi:MAG TPA: hypothetical protein VIC57_01210 [Candidatus Dormibacteraeota bacterium]